MFDFVVVDFPDPTNYSLGKLYTTAFYRLLAKHVSAGGLHRRAKHVAAVRAAVVLVHRRNAEAGRTENVAISRLRAVVRRVGIRARGPAPYEPPLQLAGGSAISGRRKTFPSCSAFPTTCCRWMPSRTG